MKSVHRETYLRFRQASDMLWMDVAESVPDEIGRQLFQQEQPSIIGDAIKGTLAIILLDKGLKWENGKELAFRIMRDIDMDVDTIDEESNDFRKMVDALNHDRSRL
jgi:hypothetical protein